MPIQGRRIFGLVQIMYPMDYYSQRNEATIISSAFIMCPHFDGCGEQAHRNWHGYLPTETKMQTKHKKKKIPL